MDLPFRIIIALLFLTFVVHRGYYNRRMPPSEENTKEVRTSGWATFLSGGFALAGLISLILYIARPAWMTWASVPFPAWLRWIGVLLAIFGLGLLHWSQLALGVSWSDTPRITKGQELVTAGPYRWIRHPIYTSFLLILGSSLLIAANWFVGGAWLVMTVIEINGRIRYEEGKMLVHFGVEYKEYLKRTGRLFPRL